MPLHIKPRGQCIIHWNGKYDPAVSLLQRSACACVSIQVTSLDPARLSMLANIHGLYTSKQQEVEQDHAVEAVARVVMNAKDMLLATPDMHRMRQVFQQAAASYSAGVANVHSPSSISRSAGSSPWGFPAAANMPRSSGSSSNRPSGSSPWGFPASAVGSTRISRARSTPVNNDTPHGQGMVNATAGYAQVPGSSRDGSSSMHVKTTNQETAEELVTSSDSTTTVMASTSSSSSTFTMANGSSSSQQSDQSLLVSVAAPEPHTSTWEWQAVQQLVVYGLGSIGEYRSRLLQGAVHSPKVGQATLLCHS